MTPEQIVRTLLGIGQVYLVLGALFALAFVTVLGPRLDPAVRTSSLGFRLVILPSLTLLWPLLFSRWVRGRGRPTECTAHRRCGRSAADIAETGEAAQ
jgi:hypothetical protein